MTNQPNYIINKHIDEVISRSEDEGWRGDYLSIALIVKDARTQNYLTYPYLFYISIAFQA